jgi:hypothetical protein
MQNKKDEFEEQVALLLKNLSVGKQLCARSKILIEDLNTMAILSVECRKPGLPPPMI